MVNHGQTCFQNTVQGLFVKQCYFTPSYVCPYWSPWAGTPEDPLQAHFTQTRSDLPEASGDPCPSPWHH